MPDDDAEPEDRPQDEPAQRSAVDTKGDRRRESRKQLAERQAREWFARLLATDPHFRQFCWSVLAAAGTFEEKYGFGPLGHPNPPATEFFRGARDVGQRLYHSWSILDRAGMLSLMDEFHPQFPKSPKGK